MARLRTTPALALFCAAGLVTAPALSADPPPKPDAKPAVVDKPLPPTGTPGELPPILFDPHLNLRVDIHGSLYLLYFQPLSTLDETRPGVKKLTVDDHFFEIYVASVELSASLGDFGVYINPRFRDSRARDFFNSNVWLHQGYLSYNLPHALIKVGKIESGLSRLNDDTFYANALYFDGLKYAYDFGLSVEGSFSGESGLGLSYIAQYFVLDGRTNGSFQDRDTAWIASARRRDTGVVRIEPSYRFSALSSLRLGVAVQAARVDLGTGSGSKPVLRVDADASFTYGPARVFAEGLVQAGQSLTSYPYAPTPAQGGQPARPGQASAQNYYALAGASVRIWRFLPHYAFSFVRYADSNVSEQIHVPGVTFTAHDNVSCTVDYGYWRRKDVGRSYLLDNSLNVALSGKF